MLWIFDTGRMAKKFRKWRGPVIEAHSVGICIIAVMVSHAANVLLHLESTLVDASTSAFAVIVIYGAGVLLGIWGACQFMMNALHGKYIEDAE